ncbi:MAG: FliO/MopB family protein [Rhodospirillales bacterium]
MDGYLRFVLALIFVIALIGVFAVIFRRLGFGFPANAMRPAGERRIGVVEVAPLDSRRKLVLVRRDDVEHLLVISPTAEVVVERNIRDGIDFRTALEESTDDGAPPASGADSQ